MINIYTFLTTRLDYWGWLPSRDWEFFCHHVKSGSGTPPSLLSNGYWGLFPWGVKWPGHEGDHSPSSRAKVKNA